MNAAETAALRTRIELGSTREANGCWLWGKRRKRVDFYGQISVRDRKTRVHRLAYELFVGPIPAGLEVCHTCDVKQCCNPEHLFVGTRKENHEDAQRKGLLQPPPVHYGERHPMAKLTDEQVRELRALHARGLTQRALAARFRISQSTVWRLAHGIWRA